MLLGKGKVVYQDKIHTQKRSFVKNRNDSQNTSFTVLVLSSKKVDFKNLEEITVR